MLLNYCAGEDSWSPLDSKEIKPFNPKGIQSWIFIWRTDVESEAPILEHLIRKANSLEKTLMVGKIEGRRTLSSVKRNNRGWDGWMASLTQWTWSWASSGRWWRTGKPGVLQSMGSQRVGHNLVTEQQQICMTSPFIVHLKGSQHC